VEILPEDVLRTIDVVNGKNSANYSKLYLGTNEKLNRLYSNFSVCGKNIFTVLSSVDQYFLAYYMGARKVDTFDRNKLTEFYYYLRKWMFEYKGMFYPEIGAIKLNNQWLYDLLQVVECSNEKEEKAYNYWYKYVINTYGFLGKHLFNFNFRSDGCKIEDLSKIKVILDTKEFSFTNLDICGEVFEKKTYDVIILSNILEYYLYDLGHIRRCRDNLYNLLNDDGIVVCSCCHNLSVDKIEKKIFLEKFDYEGFPYINSKFYKSSKLIGYQYRKLT